MKKININKERAALDKQLDLHLAKRDDYGDSFSIVIDRFGLKSILVRLFDKVHRFENLLNKTYRNFESTEDTLTDASVYAWMTVVYIYENFRNAMMSYPGHSEVCEVVLDRVLDRIKEIKAANPSYNLMEDIDYLEVWIEKQQHNSASFNLIIDQLITLSAKATILRCAVTD